MPMRFSSSSPRPTCALVKPARREATTPLRSGFLALAMEGSAKRTLLEGSPGTGQTIAEASTAGTKRVAAPQKQGTKWPL
jgi:hypothetical protein